MIYSRKRPRRADRSSTKEKLLSIFGLFGVSGFIGGLSALIYGLIKPSQSGLIGGSIVAVCSFCLCLLLVLVYFLCLKSPKRRGQRKSLQHSSHRHQHGNNERISPQPVPSVSATTQQVQLPLSQSFGQSPSKTSNLNQLNQSHTSIQSQKPTKQLRYS